MRENNGSIKSLHPGCGTTAEKSDMEEAVRVVIVKRHAELEVKLDEIENADIEVMERHLDELQTEIIQCYTAYV